MHNTTYNNKIVITIIIIIKENRKEKQWTKINL